MWFSHSTTLLQIALYNSLNIVIITPFIEAINILKKLLFFITSTCEIFWKMMNDEIAIANPKQIVGASAINFR